MTAAFLTGVDGKVYARSIVTVAKNLEQHPRPFCDDCSSSDVELSSDYSISGRKPFVPEMIASLQVPSLIYSSKDSPCLAPLYLHPKTYRSICE